MHTLIVIEILCKRHARASCLGWNWLRKLEPNPHRKRRSNTMEAERILQGIIASLLRQIPRIQLPRSHSIIVSYLETEFLDSSIQFTLNGLSLVLIYRVCHLLKKSTIKIRNWFSFRSREARFRCLDQRSKQSSITVNNDYGSCRRLSTACLGIEWSGS